jgi:hypothetical protein
MKMGTSIYLKIRIRKSKTKHGEYWRQQNSVFWRREMWGIQQQKKNTRRELKQGDESDSELKRDKECNTLIPY